MTLSEQCAQRKSERAIIKGLISRLELIAIENRNQRVDEALSRLPANASMELKRQVIREIINDAT